MHSYKNPIKITNRGKLITSQKRTKKKKEWFWLPGIALYQAKQTCGTVWWQSNGHPPAVLGKQHWELSHHAQTQCFLGKTQKWQPLIHPIWTHWSLVLVHPHLSPHFLNKNGKTIKTHHQKTQLYQSYSFYKLKNETWTKSKLKKSGKFTKIRGMWDAVLVMGICATAKCKRWATNTHLLARLLCFLPKDREIKVPIFCFLFCVIPFLKVPS